MIDAGRNSGAATVAAVKKAIEAKDFEAIATGFSRLASHRLPLIGQSPPKDGRANWDRHTSRFVKTALGGAQAAAEKDLKDLPGSVARSGRTDAKRPPPVWPLVGRRQIKMA